MRQPGQGTIDQLPSGRWRVRLTVAGAQRPGTTFASKEEAETFLNAAVAELATGNLAPVGTLTLETWGAKWLDRRETDGAHRNLKSERSVWKNRVSKAAFFDWALGEITPVSIRDWLRELGKKRPLEMVKGGKCKEKKQGKLSRQSVVHALNLVRRCLGEAVEDGHIPTNPAAEIRIPREPKTEDEWTFLTASEIAQVITCEKIPEAERLLFTFAIYQGLREGELWGLRWENVNLSAARPEVTVRWSHRKATKGGKPKTIPLLAPARAALLRWKEICPYTPQGLVFPTERGNRRQPSDDAGWAPRIAHTTRNGKPVRVQKPGLREAAGITRRVRFHDLRHTCASHLVMGTWGLAWSLQEVCAFLRHEDISVTQRYAHLSPDHLHNRAAGTAQEAPFVVTPTGHALVTANIPKTDSPANSLARDMRFERMTFGSGGQYSIPVTTRGYGSHDHSVTRGFAVELLRAIEAGEPVTKLVDGLVSSVLDNALFRLALEVSQPGSFRVRKAIELAEMVLSEEEFVAQQAIAKQ